MNMFPLQPWVECNGGISCGRLGRYGTLSTELLTDFQHNSIIKLSVHHEWKVGDGFPSPV